MDPITTAIVTALSAGTIAGLSETSKKAINDSYNKIKDLLVRGSGLPGEGDVVE